MNDELRPCPFCGGNGELYDGEKEGTSRFVNYVSCDRCGASTHYKFDIPRAIEIWNSRATDPQEKVNGR